MPKIKSHPLDSLTFTAPKLEEAQSITPPTTTAVAVNQDRTGDVSLPITTPVVPINLPVDPVTASEIETRSSNITLPVVVWEWIDRKHAEARTNGGKPLRKSAIIRAVFEVAMQAEIDLAGVQSEDEIAVRLLRALRG